MAKLRVMHLIHELGTGGAENGIVNIVNNIDHRRFEPSICAFSGGGTLTGHVDAERTTLFEMNKREGNDFFLPFMLWRLFRKQRPHIVHTHAWGTLCEGVIGAKMANVPLIIHGEHGTIQDTPRNISVQRFFWEHTDQMLSISHAHRDNLAETIGFPHEKIKVIINGVDTVRFCRRKKNEQIRKELKIDAEDCVIGTVGRLVPVKNQFILIRAFANLRKKYHAVKLLIVGDGPLRKDLINLSVSLGISSDTIFTGRRSDIPDILQFLDIFVLPSISEGTSNTILEAMSTGIPVVATAVGGNSFLIKKEVNGLLFESGNEGHLENALNKLIENPEARMKMGAAGRKRAVKKFSLQSMINHYEDLYSRLALKKGIYPS